MNGIDTGGPLGTHPRLGQPVIFDLRAVAELPENTRIVEICSGREFDIGSRPGILWHGTTRCTVHVLDLPVQVIQWPGQARR